MSLFDEPSRQPLPTSGGPKDHGISIIKGAVSAIPLVGGVLAEELGMALVPPLTARRDEWFADLAERLHELEGKVRGLRFDGLSQNEQFVSVTIQAAQIALRTHQKEKREALRDAALNVAIGTEPDEDKQTLFLSLLDRYDKLHLRLLRFFQDPAKHGFQRPEGFAATHTAIYTVLLNTLPDLSAQLRDKTEEENFAIGASIQLRVQDLANDRLVGISGPFATIPNFSTPHWTTGLGNAFLRFITTDL